VKREQRAGRLRPFVQARVDAESVRAIADQIGVPHASLHYFLKGSTPAADRLNEFERWATDHGWTPSNPEQAPISPPHADAEFSESAFAAELKRIARLEADEDTRIKARYSLAAAIRAQMALVDARAAELWAREALDAMEHKRTTALIEEAARTGRVPRSLIEGEEVLLEEAEAAPSSDD
jgi:hypothetical protein